MVRCLPGAWAANAEMCEPLTWLDEAAKSFGARRSQVRRKRDCHHTIASSQGSPSPEEVSFSRPQGDLLHPAARSEKACCTCRTFSEGVGHWVDPHIEVSRVDS